MDTINNNKSIKLTLELKFELNKYTIHMTDSIKDGGVSVYCNKSEDAAEEISKFINVYLKKLK